MSFATLMVNLNIDQSNEALLQTAGELAGRFRSQLIGVAAAEAEAQLYFVEGAAAAEVLEKQTAWLQSKINECEAEFRHVLAGMAGAIEWRSELAWPTDFIARNARAADLVIAGLGTGNRAGAQRIDSGELVMRAGRPVLLVPTQKDWLRLKSVVVGWKDTREARRAVNDALPLLHIAREVIIVEMFEDDAEQAAAKIRVDDVARWLTRRNISASSITTKALISPAGHLSVLAQDEGADVIVAGAYGHTRFQEWLFGGVTRELLRQEKHCVFLSH